MECRNLALVESLFKGDVEAFKKTFAESKSLEIFYEALQICNSKDDPIIFQMFYDRKTVETIDILSVAINFYFHFRHGQGGLQQNRLNIIKLLVDHLPTDYFNHRECSIPYELVDDFECLPALVVAGLENNVTLIQILSRLTIPKEEKNSVEKTLLYQILYHLPAFDTEAQAAMVKLLKDNGVHTMQDKTIISAVFNKLMKLAKASHVEKNFLATAVSEVKTLFSTLGLDNAHLALQKPSVENNTLFAKPLDIAIKPAETLKEYKAIPGLK